MSLSRKAYAIWRKRRQSNNTIKTLTEPPPKKQKEDPKVEEKNVSLKGGNWSLLDLFNCSREVVEIKIKKNKKLKKKNNN